MSIKEILRKLVSLQEIEYKIYHVEKKMRALPADVSRERKILEKKQVELKVREEKNTEFETERAGLETTASELEAKLAATHEKEKEIKTQREYEALDEELAALDGLMKDNERVRREVGTKITNLQADILKRKTEIEEATKRIERLDGEVSKKVGALEEEMGGHQKERETVAPGIDVEVLGMFEKIVRVKDGIGIVAIDGEICSGGYVTIPPQEINNIRKTIEIVKCPNCQRILYAPEIFSEAAVGAA